MKQLALIFLGGGLGSCLRYIISKQLNTPNSHLPYGTFTVNMLGSLIIGIITGLALKHESLSPQHTLLIATGFCGGFTTFSTFSLENQILIQNGEFLKLAIYISLSILTGIAMIFLGAWLVK